MTQSLFRNLVLLLLMIGSSTLATRAQAALEPEVGVVPIVRAENETLLFIDGDMGEILSFAVLKEPVLYAVFGEEEDTFFALTRHYIVKGKVSTGEILEEFQYMKIWGKDQFDSIDPNMNIIPLGISKNGLAAFNFNSVFLDKMRKMQGGAYKFTTDEARPELETGKWDQLELLSLQEVHLADFENKKTSLLNFGKYDPMKERVVTLNSEGELISFHMPTHTLIINDLNTATNTSFSLMDMYEEDSGLESLATSSPTTILSDSTYAQILYDPNTLTSSTADYAVVTFSVDEILDVQEYENASMVRAGNPLASGEGGSVHVYGKLNCDIAPMPTMPDLGEPQGSSKKKLARWNKENKEKLNTYSRELEAWEKKAKNPVEYCSISLFRDKDFAQPIMEIPNALNAKVYSNRFVLVNRSYEVALYDIETKEEKWVVDIDF